jgi:hypothetical protein
MKLSANQQMQLLYIHHHEPSHKIGLSTHEVVELELLLVNQHENLSGEYFERLIPKSKDALAEFFIRNTGRSPFESL